MWGGGKKSSLFLRMPGQHLGNLFTDSLFVFAWELKIDIQQLLFLAPAAITYLVELCISGMPSSSQPIYSLPPSLLFLNVLMYDTVHKAEEGDLYLNRSVCTRRNTWCKSPVFPLRATAAMQIRVHSASFHCTDAAKWLRPWSHKQ